MIKIVDVKRKLITYVHMTYVIIMLIDFESRDYGTYFWNNYPLSFKHFLFDLY